MTLNCFMLSFEFDLFWGTFHRLTFNLWISNFFSLLSIWRRLKALVNGAQKINFYKSLSTLKLRFSNTLILDVFLCWMKNGWVKRILQNGILIYRRCQLGSFFKEQFFVSPQKEAAIFKGPIATVLWANYQVSYQVLKDTKDILI